MIDWEELQELSNADSKLESDLENLLQKYGPPSDVHLTPKNERWTFILDIIQLWGRPIGATELSHIFWLTRPEFFEPDAGKKIIPIVQFAVRKGLFVRVSLGVYDLSDQLKQMRTSLGRNLIASDLVSLL